MVWEPHKHLVLTPSGSRALNTFRLLERVRIRLTCATILKTLLEVQVCTRNTQVLPCIAASPQSALTLDARCVNTNFHCMLSSPFSLSARCQNLIESLVSLCGSESALDNHMTCAWQKYGGRGLQPGSCLQVIGSTLGCIFLDKSGEGCIHYASGCDAIAKCHFSDDLNIDLRRLLWGKRWVYDFWLCAGTT